MKNQQEVTVEFLSRVETIREKLEKFDRELSDLIRPLALMYDGFDVDHKTPFTPDTKQADTLSTNFVYQLVIDKICKLNFQNPGQPFEAGG